MFFKPINGIVGIYQVTSEVFEDNSDIWGKNEYTIRVKIASTQNLLANEKNPVPLSCMFGNVTINGDFSVEPLLKNIWIIKLAPKQFEE